MINKKDSIAVYGAPGSGSRYIANGLAKKTGKLVIPVDRLMFLPTQEELDRAIRNTQVAIQNLKLDLEHYQKGTANPLVSGLTKVALFDKIKQTKKAIQVREEAIASIQPEVDLRAQFPSIKNAYELGYDKELSKILTDSYGGKYAKDFYDKQFLVKFVNHVFDNVDGSYVVDFGARAPICLTEKHEEVIHRLDSGKLLQWSLGENFVEENLDPALTTQMFEGFGVVANLRLPQNYTYTRYAAYTNPLTQDYIRNGGYEENATVSVDTTGLFEENVTAIVNAGAERQVSYSKYREGKICSEILSQGSFQVENPTIVK